MCKPGMMGPKNEKKKQAKQTLWWHKVPLVFIAALVVSIFTLDAEAETSSPTSTCPSLNEAKYQVSPLSKTTISTEQSIPNDQLAKRVCEIYSSVKTTQTPSFLAHLYSKLSVTPDLQKGKCEMTGPVGPRGYQAESIPAPVVDKGVAWSAAVAKVLAKRAESEMKAWLVDRIVSDICERDVKYYFPSFCTLSQPYVVGVPPSYAAMSRTLREDLKSLPACLIMKNSSGDGEWGYPAMNLYHLIRKKTDPLNAIAGLADSKYLKDSCRTGAEESCGLYLSGVVAHAYLVSRSTTSQDAIVLPANLIARAIDKMGPEKSYLISRLTPTTEPDFDKVYNEYKRRIEVFVEIVENIKTRVGKIGDLKKEDPTYEEETLQLAFEIGEKVADAITAAANIIREHGDTSTTIYDQRMSRIRTIVSILAAIEAERYSDAMADITKVAFCLSNVPMKEPFTTECKPWADRRENLFPIRCLTKDKGTTECKKAGKNREAIDTIMRYTPLVVELAGAKTTDDVTAALDRAASPVGAWRLKRERGMISLGALVGMAGGRERLDGAPTGRERGTYSALFAPVGFDFSLPSGSWTWGVFASLVDVGNLMSVSMSDGQAITVNEESNTSWKQIYSPGIYFRVGIGRSPFVAGFGIAKSPALRDAVLSDGSSIKLDSTRISGFVAIDIPLLPLF